MPIIPALRRLRQADQELECQPGLHSEFEASLSYIPRPCLKNQQQQKKKGEAQWLICVIPTTREAESRKIMV
jgi:hypothetical protein